MMEKKFQHYSRGDAQYSVTELIDSPRIVRLKRQHELTTDYSSMWGAFIGTLIHKALEDSSQNGIKECRLFYTFEGVTISGQPDFVDLETHTLVDYKTGGEVSLFGFEHREWEEQLNIYAFLLREYGIPIYNAYARRVAVDWREESRASQVPCDALPIRLWSREEQELFLHNRIRLHLNAVENLPLCSSDDMWERPTRWAVMRQKQKRAVRLFDTKEEATDFLDPKEFASGKMYLEERPGERVRCEKYCPCAPVCTQYKEYCDANK